MAFTVVKGFCITYIFAVTDLVSGYDKMRLPYSQSMKDALSEIKSKSSRVGINLELLSQGS